MACVLASAIAVASCSNEQSPETDASASRPPAIATTPLNAYEQQRSDGVGALLDEMSSTVRAGDRAGLDRLIDPVASDAFAGRLRAAAAAFAAGDRGRRGGPLRPVDFTYRLAPVVGGERQLVPDVAARLETSGSSDTWVSPVELTYSLGGASTPGLDEPTVTLTDTFAFARYGDDWKVVGDSSVAPDPQVPDPYAEPDDRPAETGPWAFPGLAASDVRTAGGTSVVLSYPGTEQIVDRLRDLLPAAVGAVEKFWGPDWPRRAALVATGAADEFSGLTRTKADQTRVAAAATVYSHLDRRAGRVSGQRIVFTPAARQLSEPALGVVLRHELTHVAARLTTADNAPVWLTEGVAEYVGRKGTYRDFVDAAPDLAAAVAAGDVPKSLPADGAFAVDDDAARLAYQSAWSFAAFVAREYGEDRLKAMYAAVARGGDTAAMDAALGRALGADRAQVVKAWQAWLRKEVR